MNKFLQPQIKAVKLSIHALEDYRRRHYAAAHAAHLQGIQPDEIDCDGVKGTAFLWVAEGEKKYQEYTKAISEMYDLLDIINDPGVVTAEEESYEPGE